MKRRLVSTVLTVAMMSVALAGCGNSPTSETTTPEPAEEDSEPESSPQEESDAEETAQEEKAPEVAGDAMVIGFDMNANTCPYCLKFANLIEKYATEAGFKAIITQSDGDVATQISNAESMLVNGATIISGIWGDKDACLPIIDACIDYDAVCISTLTSLADEGNGYGKYIYLGSENYDGGYLQGEWLAKNLPEGAGIWYLSSAAGDQQCIDRQEGMEKALEDAGRTDVEIVAFEYTDNMMDQGLEVMENWLQAYDTIDCVVGSADLSVLGAIEAAKAADRMDNTIWVGLDGQDVALESIQNGEMDMTVYQDAKSQAIALIDVFKQIRDGKDASEIDDVLIPFKAITSENVGEFVE